jgi:hypothetical protein
MTAVAIVECAHANVLPNQDGLWLMCGLSLCPQWNPPMEKNVDYPLGLLSVIVPAFLSIKKLYYIHVVRHSMHNSKICFIKYY